MSEARKDESELCICCLCICQHFCNNSFCLFMILSSLFLVCYIFYLKTYAKFNKQPSSQKRILCEIVPWLWMPLVSLLLALSNGPLCHVQSTLKWLLFASALFWGKKRRKRKRIACLTCLLNIRVLFLSGTLKNTCLACSLHPFSPDSCKFLILDISDFEFST